MAKLFGMVAPARRKPIVATAALGGLAAVCLLLFSQQGSLVGCEGLMRKLIQAVSLLVGGAVFLAIAVMVVLGMRAKQRNRASADHGAVGVMGAGAQTAAVASTANAAGAGEGATSASTGFASGGAYAAEEPDEDPDEEAIESEKNLASSAGSDLLRLFVTGALVLAVLMFAGVFDTFVAGLAIALVAIALFGAALVALWTRCRKGHPGARASLNVVSAFVVFALPAVFLLSAGSFGAWQVKSDLDEGPKTQEAHFVHASKSRPSKIWVLMSRTELEADFVVGEEAVILSLAEEDELEIDRIRRAQNESGALLLVYYPATGIYVASGPLP